MTDLSKDFDSAIETSAKKVSETLTGTLLNLAKDQFQKLKLDLHSGFKEISRHQYEKCSRVKTLLYRDEPAELVKLYVPTTFKVGQKDNVIDDSTLISNAINRTRYLVSGTAGSGKSVFMKYLCLKLITQQVPFPIFLELRDLNDENDPSIVRFIATKLNSVTGDFSLAQLEYGLRQGAFFLILDGFDELNSSIRAKVEKDILGICHVYINCGLVVSARPNPIFDSWPNFCKASVQKLSQTSVSALIMKLEFNHIVKQKFLDKLPGLYSSHEEFLSNPLLATMMLLTFDQFADIPTKIHVFYEKAFIALFERHDALKFGYHRQSFANLSIDDFKRLFSAFCLITYMDETFSFDRSQLLEYACQAKNLEQIDVDENLWLKDLLESVCLLVLDGDTISFSHRSFQEYFSAVYLTSTGIVDVYEIIEAMAAKRIDDDVLELAFQINKDNIEKQYVIPELLKLLNLICSIDTFDNCSKYFNVFYDGFSLRKVDENWSLSLNWRFESETRFRHEFVDRLERWYGPLVGLWDVIYNNKNKEIIRESRKNSLGGEITEADDNWLKKTSWPQGFKKHREGLVALLQKIQKAHETKRSLLSNIVLKKRGDNL
jgi:hypothetical protein